MRRFREDSGNAGMVARELPSAEVLASWQHVEQRALDLRAAGMPGTLQDLRVQAYLDLLQERDSRDLPAAAPPAARQPAPDQPHRTAGSGGPGSEPGPGGPAARRPCPGPGPGRPAPARAGAGPSVAALVTITVPLATFQASPRHQGKPPGSGCWTATTPAT